MFLFPFLIISYFSMICWKEILFLIKLPWKIKNQLCVCVCIYLCACIYTWKERQVTLLFIGVRTWGWDKCYLWPIFGCLTILFVPKERECVPCYDLFICGVKRGSRMGRAWKQSEVKHRNWDVFIIIWFVKMISKKLTISSRIFKVGGLGTRWLHWFVVLISSR